MYNADDVILCNLSLKDAARLDSTCTNYAKVSVPMWNIKWCKRLSTGIYKGKSKWGYVCLVKQSLATLFRTQIVCNTVLMQSSWCLRHCASSGYWSHYCLSVVSSQSDHSPPTPDNDKGFFSPPLPLDISPFWNRQVNPGDWHSASAKVPVDQHFVKHSDRLVWHWQPWRKSFLPRPRARNALSRRNLIG